MKIYSNFKKFIKKDRVYFFSKKISNNITNEEDMKIAEVFQKIKLETEEEITLKIDIEGDEYNIIDDVLSYEKILLKLLWNIMIHKKKDLFFNNVKKFQKFYNIIHIHGNNYRDFNSDGFPINIEITFCKKKIY